VVVAMVVAAAVAAAATVAAAAGTEKEPLAGTIPAPQEAKQLGTWNGGRGT
jgi:hypothetical protein